MISLEAKGSSSILEVEYSNICTFQIVGECNLGDLNNDGTISIDEINKSIKLIFQLIDVNQDENISQEEIIELQNILEILS